MTSQPPGVPLREAAERLGTSVDAIRKRIRRGSLEAHKDDSGRWYVVLPVVQDTASEESTETDTGHSTSQPIMTASPPVDSEHLMTLQLEVDRLWDQIRVKDDTIAGLMEQLKTVSERLPELPSGPVGTERASHEVQSPQESNAAPELTSRSWWKFWE
jgi:hypothetical protein